MPYPASINSGASWAESWRSMQKLLQGLIAEHERLDHLLQSALRNDACEGGLQAQSCPHLVHLAEPDPACVRMSFPSCPDNEAMLQIMACSEIQDPSALLAPRAPSEPPAPSAPPEPPSVLDEECKSQDQGDCGIEVDATADEASRFAAFMLERFATIEQAFQQLDANHNGSLSKVEFVHAVQKVKYEGDPFKVWSRLHEDGQIRMEQFRRLNKFARGADNNEPTATSSYSIHASDEDDERLQVCLHKLQTKCAASRQGYITNRDVAALLVGAGAVSDDSSEAINELFTTLGGTVVKSRSLGFRRDPSRSLTRLSVASGSHEMQVSLVSFAELLVQEKASLELSDRTRDVLAHIRKAVFDEDAVNLIMYAMDLKHSDLVHEEGRLIDKAFDVIMNAIILANAACIGYFANEVTTGAGWGTQQTVDLIFTIIFLLEMAVKIKSAGIRGHFLGKDWRWNCFDASVVLLGVSDSAMTMAISLQSESEESFNTSSLMALRMIRLARIARLARVMRVSLLRELQLMLNGIAGLLRTLLCAILLLFLTVYFLGICVTQLFNEGNGVKVAGQDLLFSDVPRSMFTVFRCLTVGDCAAIDGTPISLQLSESVGWPYVLAYSVCCVLMNYGLGSLITALVVDSTLNAAKQTEFKHSMRTAEKKKLGGRIRDLTVFFERGQTTYNAWKRAQGEEADILFMDRACFIEVLQRDDVKQLLDEIEIDEADRLDLFDALDADGNGRIEMKELIDGIVKMRGKARKADVVATRLMLAQLVSKVSSLEAEVRDNHREVIDCVLGDGR